MTIGEDGTGVTKSDKNKKVASEQFFYLLTIFGKPVYGTVYKLKNDDHFTSNKRITSNRNKTT